MFIKVLGLEEHTKTLSPNEMMGILNTVFSEFDRITSALKLEKIKTIGTTYMVVGGNSNSQYSLIVQGVPIGNETHLWDIADMALRVRRLVVGYKTSPFPLDVQIGINVGPCVAGIIGTKRISFDLWGDAINTASRMTTFGAPGYIQLTEAAALKLKGHYLLQERGKIAVKGKGTMTTYWLTGQKSPLGNGHSFANFVSEENQDDQPVKEEDDLIDVDKARVV
jgi:adenylate cyclase